MYYEIVLATPIPNGAWNKKEEYPRKVKEGTPMDYTSVAFPKPKGKKKKKR